MILTTEPMILTTDRLDRLISQARRFMFAGFALLIVQRFTDVGVISAFTLIGLGALLRCVGNEKATPRSRGGPDPSRTQGPAPTEWLAAIAADLTPDRLLDGGANNNTILGTGNSGALGATMIALTTDRSITHRTTLETLVPHAIRRTAHRAGDWSGARRWTARRVGAFDHRVQTQPKNL